MKKKISRFQLMDLGDEIENAYKEKLRKEKEEEDKKYEEYLRKEEIRIEKEGCCDNDDSNIKRRWIHNDEFYVCYDCFIEGLSNEASVMVPIHSVDQMRDYIEDCEWDELWELEQEEKSWYKK